MGYCGGARPGRVAKMVMAASDPDQDPPVRLYLADDRAAFHGHTTHAGPERRKRPPQALAAVPALRHHAAHAHSTRPRPHRSQPRRRPGPLVRVPPHPERQRPARPCRGLRRRCRLGARPARGDGLPGRRPRHAGPSHRAWPPPRPFRHQPAPLVLRPLRRAACRAAGAMDQPALRPRDAGRPQRPPRRRPRRRGRQGPGHDVAGGPARLARRPRHPARPRHRPGRGRRGSQQREPGTLPGRPPRHPAGRRRRHQRHRHVGRGHPGADHPAARHRLRPGRDPRCQPGPALRHVRRLRPQPGDAAGPHPGRPA